jgi:hypothetical protein
MKRKEALKIISEKLKEGKTKPEIYKELSSKVKFKSDLTQYLAMVPSNEDRIKYNTLNKILFFLLIFISLTKIFFAALILGRISLFALPFALLVPFLSLYFAYFVWNFWNMYRPLGGLAFAGLLKSLSNIDQIFSYNWLGVTIEISFDIPTILVIILAYYIGVNAFPYYGFWGNLKEKKLNLQADAKNRAAD